MEYNKHKRNSTNTYLLVDEVGKICYVFFWNLIPLVYINFFSKKFNVTCKIYFIPEGLVLILINE